jgi:hypothetical protein
MPQFSSVVACLETIWSPQTRQDGGQSAYRGVTQPSLPEAPGSPYAALLAHRCLQAAPARGELYAVTLEQRTLRLHVRAQHGGASAQRLCPVADVLPFLVCHHETSSSRASA